MIIANRTISKEEPPYIVAEIGVNHDGDSGCALSLVDAAAKAGANAVKTQLFKADLLMAPSATLASYQQKAGENDPVAMLQRLELTLDTHRAIADRAHRHGMHAIATVFNTELVESTTALGIDAFKVASPDIVHKPLLEALASTQKPILLSTGAATLDEIQRATGWLTNAHNRIALFQCVSSYPTPDALAALGGIEAIAKTTGFPTGYSDHTTSIDTGGLAVAAGACMLEKHLTHDKNATGPDHATSIDPMQFAEYVRLAHRAHSMRGPSTKTLLDIEHDVRKVSRQSIVAAQYLAKGSTITRNSVRFARPGDGLAPWRIDEILNRTATRDIDAGETLFAKDVS